MSSIGKVQAAITSATQETTLALANLSFDFALVKVEAPPEYRALASNLSPGRIAAAESGSLHLTARRLGSLFEDVLPETPKLAAAYGKRVSAISEEFKPVASNKFGPFHRYAGIDGTSIWAAATSGPPAIAVHLLACMLARLWPCDESIAIWRELVIARKKELQGPPDAATIKLNNIVLAQIQITDDQLAELDASARAWLRAADRVDIVAHKQAGILDFVHRLNGLAINNFTKVQQSVMRAWTTALKTIEHVVGGASFGMDQQASVQGVHVEEGAVLLALVSWHLYPDVVHLGPSQYELMQADTLMHPGGKVVVGFGRSATQDDTGIRWSLSLAHLKYYGTPVTASKSITSTGSSRWTFEQFAIVVLGSLLGSWQTEPSEVDATLEVVLRFCEALEVDDQKSKSPVSQQSYSTWHRIITRAALAVMGSANDEAKICRKLLSAGMRKPNLICGDPRRSNKYFGTNGWGIVDILEKGFDFLKNVALRIDNRPNMWIITLGDALITFFGTWYRVKSRNEENVLSFEEMRHLGEVSGLDDPIRRMYPARGIATSHASFQWYNPPAEFLLEADLDNAKGKSQKLLKNLRLGNPMKLERSKENKSSGVNQITFEFVGGGFSGLSLYKRVTARSSQQTSAILETPFTSQESITDIFGMYGLSAAGLARLLNCQMTGLPTPSGAPLPSQDIILSLHTLEHCAYVYLDLPEATISPRLLEIAEPICSWTWYNDTATEGITKGYTSFEPSMYLTRAHKFACIAMMDTGVLALNPRDLEFVLALASEDSIYVAASLVSDPASATHSSEIRRIFGNIGRAGVALLISPEKPEVRKADADQWILVNHDDYDGKLENCFENTSLHLEFTGYERPVQTSNHGGRFVEAFFIESRVSVYEKGIWVADVDVLKAIDPQNFRRIDRMNDCRGSLAGGKPDFALTSIDCWEELIQPPMLPGIVRAHGNWQARLAAQAISVSLGYNTYLFGMHGCWSCATKFTPTQKIRWNDQHGHDDVPSVGVRSARTLVFIM